MKKHILKKMVVGLFLSMLFPQFNYAQILFKQIPLKQQVENSSLIVEGKVISKKSFKDTGNGLIYTANTVEVYKVFKGEPLSTIEVITLGGTVGLRALIVHPSLKLQNEDIGIFTLVNRKESISNNKIISNLKEFKTYGSVQGFYKYNLRDNIAVNPFNKKQGIKTSFYNEIMAYTKKAYTIISNFDVEDVQAKMNLKQLKGLLPPSALTLNKTMVTAGTKEVLTITGSGFGGTQGKVWFSNADDGGGTFISALDTQVTWSDTAITVEVPSNAGTGSIYVEDSSNAQSPLSSLTVTSSELNVVSGANAYQVQHFDENASGGYTWEMQTDFFNDTEHPGAKAAFESAFNEWVCQSGINWTISGTATTTDVIGVADLDPPLDGELDDDNENVIRFDNGNELDTNVLGTCYSWYGSCNGTDWLITSLDIVFDSETNWYFGTGLPGISEYDFQSVALHELGHGHQLGHTIDTSFDGDNLDDVMHYALSNAEQQRVLTTDNISAANNVQARSTSSSVCSQTSMTDASCPLSVAEEELKMAINIFPNPAKGLFYIKNEAFVNLEKVVIYDLSGRLISEQDISNSSIKNTINLLDVSKGLYFVNIYSDTAHITKKIVIE